MKPIFITGANGNITKHVVRLLLDSGMPIRIGNHSVTKTAEKAVNKKTDEVYFDFLKPHTYTAAVSGCSSVFMIRPPAIANTRQTLNVFIECAYKAGVEHIVFVSVAGAESNSLVPHHAVEQQLIKSGNRYTILRPGFFAQNLESAYLNDIKNDDRLYLPSGHGLVNFIDARDIAKVAVMSLMDSTKHSNKAYTLAGSQAVTFEQVADMLSLQLNRKITYVPASVIGYMHHLYKQKLPLIQIVIQTILHVGIRKGQAHIVDNTLSQLLPDEPLTIQDYIHDYKDYWCLYSGK